MNIQFINFNLKNTAESTSQLTNALITMFIFKYELNVDTSTKNNHLFCTLVKATLSTIKKIVESNNMLITLFYQILDPRTRVIIKLT